MKLRLDRSDRVRRTDFTEACRRHNAMVKFLILEIYRYRVYIIVYNYRRTMLFFFYDSESTIHFS